MKALVLEEYGKLVFREVPDPLPSPGEVVVRVKACGICGSDIHGFDGSTGRRIPPLIMGHEAAGVIHAAGDGTASWRPGDRVTFDSTIFCGECWYCRRGRVNLCDNRRVLGVHCAEYRQDGAFAEFVCVPARILHRLPDNVSFERAALVEAVSVALHAIRRATVSPGDTGVVVGAGMIGLLLIQALRRAGCTTIVAVDVDAERRNASLALGADVALDSGPDTAGKLRDMTQGRGADVGFEVVGATPALAVALECVRKGGALTLVGNISPSVTLALQSAVTREITLHGSCANCWDYPACLSLIEGKEINVDALISAVAPLAEGPRFFQRLYDREKGLMKVVLVP